LGFPPLLKAFIPYTYDASRRAQAHRRRGYSPELRGTGILRTSPVGVLGSSYTRNWITPSNTTALPSIDQRYKNRSRLLATQLDGYTGSWMCSDPDDEATLNPNLRAAEKGSDKQYVVCPKPADHTDHRLLRVLFPLIWASFPINCRPIVALIPSITHLFGRAPSQ
jgi:hypothetical protein